MSQFTIVAATANEVQIALDHFGIIFTGEKGFYKSEKNPAVGFLITGVGMVNTAFMMGLHHAELTGTVINAGICGTFDRSIQLGEIVHITSDRLAELGAEDGAVFLAIEDMHLGEVSCFAANPPVSDLLHGLPEAKGITVNMVHGHEPSIRETLARVEATVESMEGAAFFSACRLVKGNYLQIRAVSNYVERRDRSKWNIPLAVKTLNTFLIDLIEEQR